MATPKCAYCGVEITLQNQSREHILQNAIGDRLDPVLIALMRGILEN